MIQSVTKGAILAAEESGLNAAQVIKLPQGAIEGGLEVDLTLKNLQNLLSSSIISG